MLILFLINDQYLQNVAFSFEKGSSVQNHSLSDFHKKIPPRLISHPPLPYNTICKTLDKGSSLFAYSKLNSTFLLTIFFSQ